MYRSRHFCNHERMLTEIEQAKMHLLANQYKPDNHHFLVHTISKLTDCDMCRRPLLGIVHQCLGCQRCGLMVHRQCSSIGLPKCRPPDLHRHHENRFKTHYIFGVSGRSLFFFLLDLKVCLLTIIIIFTNFSTFYLFFFMFICLRDFLAI